MSKFLGVVLFPLALAAAAQAGAAAQTGAAQPPERGSQMSPDDVFCVMCHGEAAIWEGEQQRLHISLDMLKEDIHFTKGVNCHDCHGGNPSSTAVNEAHAEAAGFRKPLERVKEACGVCHKEEAIDVQRKGVHAKAGKNELGQSVPLSCDQCHGVVSHRLLPPSDPRSPVFLDNQIETCGGCHPKDLDSYNASVHGHGLREAGLLSVAACADCHGAHGIYRAPDNRSTLNPVNVANTCGQCHRFLAERLQRSVHGQGNGPGGATQRAAPGGKIKKHPSCTDCHQGHDLKEPKSTHFRVDLPNRCGNCHADLAQRYALSLHGQLTELGYGPAAKCSDCHGAHDILPMSDPQSRLAPGNRVQTCRQCHAYAVANFADFDPHADHLDSQRYPRLNAVYLGMEILLYSVFGFFGVHTLLWFARSLVHTLIYGRSPRLIPGQKAYVRFEPIHRMLHLIVIVSFLGLALTGLPLKYSGQAWAKKLALAWGGFDSTSVWHHIFAVATFFYFTAHLVWMARKIVELRISKVAWMTIFFGPDSPLPNWRDGRDLYRMIRWFLGAGPKPTFDRWTYWEKFDYWAVFWGVGVIGATGLILWFPNVFTRLLPGEILNISKVIHSEEALLATGFIFAIHFFNNHFRPEKAPMDMCMFTGLTSEGDLAEERPEFLARMHKEGKLAELAAPVPSRMALWFIMFSGFAALAAGLALLAGMIYASLGH